MTEWIVTEDGSTKEDCELNAFKRLAVKLKEAFPKLSICLIMDGLYANAPVFEICHSSDWKYMMTFKDKSLKSLWREIHEKAPESIYPKEGSASAHQLDGGHLCDDLIIPNQATGTN